MKELSLHIIDLIQNSIEANANKIILQIDENLLKDRFVLSVIDNGRGMSADLLKKVTDPFFTTRTTRRIGLGIPLLKAACERCDGSFHIQSSPGEGTVVTAEFQHSHIDRAPLGNIVNTLINTIASYPQLDFTYIHTINEKKLVLDTHELRQELEDIPLNNPAVVKWMTDYLVGGFRQLNEKR